MSAGLATLLVIVVALGVVFAVAAAKPATFTITRQATIAAPPDRIYALLADFHQWPRWAPQDRSDPSLRRDYSGPARGIGAVSTWTGSGAGGQGRMEITAADEPRELTVTVDFEKPFRARNTNRFTLAPAGRSTQVTWAMTGTNVFAAKVMSLFANMDKIIGRHFEAGLANLKAEAEK